MPPAASPISPSVKVQPTAQAPPTMVSEAYVKDTILAWFRGEFAAANAIIDALCNHLTQLEGGGSEYESVFAAIHRRRLNWIPVLQMQKYYSITDVALELRRVAEKKAEGGDVKKGGEELKVSDNEQEKSREVSAEESTESSENGCGVTVDDDWTRDESPESEITDTGSQEVENLNFCCNHGDCNSRLARIKITKGFVAKEPLKGHLVNVVRGLKLYEYIFTDLELSKLNVFVDELRVAGRNGELSGETYILYNRQTKKNKREQIQLGVPIFGHVKEEILTKHVDGHIEPIPTLLQGVIDHLIQWHLISENRKPNSCIINFFDEGEFSQPFSKPPHLDQPISTLLLSESTMAFGRTLVSDSDGNYKGHLMLSLKEGSLLIMRGNSSDMARHVMCPSPNKRVSITFFKVRIDMNPSNSSTTTPLTRAMTSWQPGVPGSHALPNGDLNGYKSMSILPDWGVHRAPVVMLAPMVLSSGRIPPSGTGVFLPWTVGSRKRAKQLPPRAQKGRLFALPSPVDTHVEEPTSGPSISIEEQMV